MTLRQILALAVLAIGVAGPAAAQHVPPADATPAPGTLFHDFDGAPEMIVIPPGAFVMGSTPEEIRAYADISTSADEGPQHTVTIARPFAVGKFEVTRGQFRQFVKETGRVTGDNCVVWTGETLKKVAGNSWRKVPFQQTDAHPVVCLTYADMQAYIDWLVLKTGRAYRLLSEAEWDYVNRAGSRSLFFYGDDEADLCKYGNVNDQTSLKFGGGGEAYARWSFAACTDGFARTAPVGSFKPNAFGVYDTIGNVWERLADCYHDSYVGAPTDGSAWIEGGDCNFRNMRGSGWRNRPAHYRSNNRVAAYHTNVEPTLKLKPGQLFKEPFGGFNYYGDYVGFRVAMSL